jgi:hypothetical protein
LINGALAENVYWVINGAVNINDYSVFNGTMVCNNGAINLNLGVTFNGRALDTDGQVATNAVTIAATNIPGDCTISTSIQPINGEDANEVVTIYPNPFTTHTTFMINNPAQIINCAVRIYNVLGEEVMNMAITQQSTNLETSNLPSGIYFYQFISSNKLIQSGKLIALK